MTLSDAALLILRVTVGLTFAAHGAQKAFGWWEGPGPERWHGAIASMGFRPARLFAVLSIAAELVGGLAVALGFLAVPAAAVLVAQSVVIVVHAHLPKGFFSKSGGIEFPLVLGVGALTVGLMTAGALSLDAVLRIAFSPSVRLALMGLGLIAGVVAVVVPRAITAPARPPLRRT
jgi:putative oxidoreductase